MLTHRRGHPPPQPPPVVTSCSPHMPGSSAFPLLWNKDRTPNADLFEGMLETEILRHRN